MGAVVVSQGEIGQDLVLVAISSVVRGTLAPTDYTVQAGHPDDDIARRMRKVDEIKAELDRSQGPSPIRLKLKAMGLRP